MESPSAVVEGSCRAVAMTQVFCFFMLFSHFLSSFAVHNLLVFPVFFPLISIIFLTFISCFLLFLS